MIIIIMINYYPLYIFVFLIMTIHYYYYYQYFRFHHSYYHHYHYDYYDYSIMIITIIAIIIVIFIVVIVIHIPLVYHLQSIPGHQPLTKPRVAEVMGVLPYGISSCPTRNCCHAYGTSLIQILCVLHGTRSTPWYPVFVAPTRVHVVIFGHFVLECIFFHWGIP